MKIVVTGSLGNISKPLVAQLLAKGNQVTVISSKPGKKSAIEALGATAAIGNIEDVDFLTATFCGANTVYTMMPPFDFEKNLNTDARSEAKKHAGNYSKAIVAAGIKRVVHLSSVGAHTDKGNGLLAFHYVAEQELLKLPPDVVITFMRPVGFYYNLLQYVDIVKGEGFLKGFVGIIMTLRFYGLMGLIQGKRGLIVSNFGGDDKMPWVSPIDIASAIADEMDSPQAETRKITYVASEVLTCSEIATILGTAVGKPWLVWGTISDKQMEDALVGFKLPKSTAHDIVEMNASMRNGGMLFEDYNQHKPKLGSVKMRDFAKDFAAVYHK